MNEKGHDLQVNKKKQHHLECKFIKKCQLIGNFI